MDIPVPRATQGPCALFVIDVQPQTLEGDTARQTLERIARFVAARPYDAYVVAEYYISPECMFARQRDDHHLTWEEAGPTDPRILATVAAHGRPTHTVRKTSASCFEGPGRGALCAFLEQHAIAEAHFVGFDVDDCVFASAMSAFDRGLWSFVLEDLAHQYAGREDLRDAALTLLRNKNQTNRSALASVACDTVRV